MTGIAFSVFGIVFATMVVYAVLSTFVIGPARARRGLLRWAEANALSLQESRFCFVRTGPFSWGRRGTRVVFRILVTDADGRARSGFALAGYRLFGFFDPAVDVVWDTTGPGEAQPPAPAI